MGLISIHMHYVYNQESYCLNMGHADGDFRHSNEQKATLTESPPLGHADCDFQHGHEHKSTLTT